MSSAQLNTQQVASLLRHAWGGRYFHYFCDFELLMSKLDALFLTDLLNRSSLAKIKTKEVDGVRYFQCTEKFLANCKTKPKWTRDEQVKHFNKLRKLGFVHTKIMGVPGRRWVTINEMALGIALEAARAGELSSKDDNCKSSKDDNCKSSKDDTKKQSTNVDCITKKEHAPRASHARRSLSDYGGGMNGVVPEHQVKPRHTPYHLYCAQVLYQAIEHNLPGKRYQSLMAKWPDQFRLGEKHHSQDEIERALNWLVNNEDEKKGPTGITGPKVFFRPQVFQWLLDLARKEVKSGSQIPISNVAIEMANSVRRNWQKGAEKDLPRAIQISLNYLEELTTKLQALRKRLKAEWDQKTEEYRQETGKDNVYVGAPGLWNCTNKILDKLYIHTSTIITTYFQQLADDLGDWEGWSGNLLLYAMSRKCKRFNQLGRTWNDLWDQLMEAVDEG